MTDSLKDNWTKVGKGFATLGKDLGVSIAKSVRKGVDKATEWSQEKEVPADVIEEEPEKQ